MSDIDECDHCGHWYLGKCCHECYEPGTTPQDDPRYRAVMAYAWNTSNWPEHLQRHILGRPVPFDFVCDLLAAADAVDPLRVTPTREVTK